MSDLGVERVCGVCGKRNDGAAKFCERCDAFLDFTAAPVPDVEPPVPDEDLPGPVPAGVAAPQDEVPPVDDGKECSRPDCRFRNPPQVLFCLKCDNFLPWEDPPVEEATDGSSGATGAADDEATPGPVLPGVGDAPRAHDDEDDAPTDDEQGQPCGVDGCDRLVLPGWSFCHGCGARTGTRTARVRDAKTAVVRSLGADAVARLLHPSPTVRPVPPGSIDAVRAGVADEADRPTTWWRYARIPVAALVVLLVLLAGFAVRRPAAAWFSYQMSELGIRRYDNYRLVSPATVSAKPTNASSGGRPEETRVAGRSGRYVSDGLATTYWAVDADPAVTPPNPYIEFTFGRPLQLDQLGVSIGIQNGDAPFRSNPRPRYLVVVYGRCPMEAVPGDGCTREKPIEVRDDTHFHRYDLEVRSEVTAVRVYVETGRLYPEVKAVSENALFGTTAAAALPVKMVAVTELAFFQHKPFAYPPVP